MSGMDIQHGKGIFFVERSKHGVNKILVRMQAFECFNSLAGLRKEGHEVGCLGQVRFYAGRSLSSASRKSV